MRSDGVHNDVLRQIKRLGGTIPGTIEVGVNWTDAPRPLPLEIETLMAITWPPRTLLVTDEDGYRVSLPQGMVGGAPFDMDRPCFVIGFNETTQYYWVVDLDDPRPGDPDVYRMDHDGSDVEDAFASPRRLSRMLAELTVYAPRTPPGWPTPVPAASWRPWPPRSPRVSRWGRPRTTARR